MVAENTYTIVDASVGKKILRTVIKYEPIFVLFLLDIFLYLT